MKFKKELAGFLLIFSGFFIHLGSVSLLGIGLEDMPESIKKLR